MKLNFWLLEDLIDMVFVQWSSGPIQFELDGRTGPIDGTFLGGFNHIFKKVLLDWTGPVQWSSGPVQFELDRTGPVQWSSGPVQFELDGRTGPIDGVFLGGFNHIFKKFYWTGPDQSSDPVVQSSLNWTGPDQSSDPVVRSSLNWTDGPVRLTASF